MLYKCGIFTFLPAGFQLFVSKHFTFIFTDLCCAIFCYIVFVIGPALQPVNNDNAVSLLTAVDVARERHCGDDRVQVFAVAVFGAVQREHADQNATRRKSLDADQQQEHAPSTD